MSIRQLRRYFGSPPIPSGWQSMRLSERIPSPETGGKLSKLFSNDWYWLIYAPREQETGDLTELATWVASAGKFTVLTNEPGEPAAIVTQMKTAAAAMETSRVVLFAHTEPSKYPDAALVGRMAPLQPGSATFKFKTLDGVPEADGTAEILGLHDLLHHLCSQVGVLQTSEAVTDRTYATFS